MTTTQLTKPALLGGPKVKTTPFGRGFKHDADAESDALRKRLQESEKLPLAMGPSILELRRQMCDMFGVRHCIPTSSGTAAIHAGLAALGIEPGDEVITTPCTDHGTIIGIMQLGAIPVFADVDPATAMSDLASIEGCITDRTRAILVVHLCGCPMDMDAVMALAQKHKLKVLEDAAQSWLAEWNGQLVGTIGHAGAFSMNESKHVSVGEGGIVLTNDDVIAGYMDRFVDKSYNRGGDGPIAPSMPALNYRLSEINAVLALEQIARLPQQVARRRARAATLAKAIEGVPGIRLQEPPTHSESSYWYGMLLVDAEKSGLDASTWIDALVAEGIESGRANVRNVMEWPLFQKLNEDPEAFPGYRPPGLMAGRFHLESCPHAAALASRAIRVPLNEFVTDEDMREIGAAIHKISQWYCHS